MKIHVLAVLFGLWEGTAKGERNETTGWPKRNGMNGSALVWVAEAGG